MPAAKRVLRIVEAGNPYKGQASYAVEDAHIFFGRDGEAAELSARILANRLSVLHAPSGAGKTSLLNARILPGLEVNGWFPVMSRLEDDPVAAIRRNTLHALLPPPETEQLALDTAIAFLQLSDQDTVGELLHRFDTHCERHPTGWRDLVAPIEKARPDATSARVVPFESTHDLDRDFIAATPYVVRLLRKSVDVARVENHFQAIRQAGSEMVVDHAALDESTRLGDVRAALADPVLRQAYRALYSWLRETPPGLRPFFARLCELYGEEFPSFGIVLILDQFEELFTRFGGGPATASRKPPLTSVLSKSSGPVLNGQLRDTFWRELARLYLIERDPAAPGAMAELPIRYVISLRDEYVGRLGPIRKFVSDLDRFMYRLAWLPKPAAEAAIRGPALQAGYTYSTPCVTAILDGLAIDDEIKPGPLQIVCHWVWEHRPDGQREIGVDALGPGGITGIWDAVFRKYFQDEFEPDEQLALLDLLAPLITASGTRNIVERAKLVSVGFWKRDKLERLLKRLEDDRILRKETRVDTEFFEIMHEFLIQPILDALQESPDYRQLNRALSAMARAGYEGRGELELDRDDFDTLNSDHIKSALDWRPWMIELMLRTAVVQRADPDDITAWAGSYESSPVVFPLNADGPERFRLLTASELQLLSISSMADDSLDVLQVERVINSQIAASEPLDVALFTAMARRLDTHVRPANPSQDPGRRSA